MERAASVKTFVKVGRRSKEVTELLMSGYGDDAISDSMVFPNYRLFKDGRESITDGRKGLVMKKTACTNENTAVIASQVESEAKSVNHG